MFVRAQQLLKNNIQYPQKEQNYANTFLFLWNNSKYANMCFYSFFLYFYTKNWALWIRMYIEYTVQMTLGRSYVDTKYSMSVPFARYNSSFPPGKWISGKNDGLSKTSKMWDFPQFTSGWLWRNDLLECLSSSVCGAATFLGSSGSGSMMSKVPKPIPPMGSAPGKKRAAPGSSGSRH